MTAIQILVLLIVICILYTAYEIFNHIIFPKMVYKGMKETGRNPKWIMTKLSQYYGFNDVDIVLCNSKWGMLPCMRMGKEKLELWIDENTLTKDVEDVGVLALGGVLKMKYNVWNPDKPIYWQSILLYMLDGGEIEVRDKIKQETS